jgi:hypothetical protein
MNGVVGCTEALGQQESTLSNLDVEHLAELTSRRHQRKMLSRRV